MGEEQSYSYSLVCNNHIILITVKRRKCHQTLFLLLLLVLLFSFVCLARGSYFIFAQLHGLQENVHFVHQTEISFNFGWTNIYSWSWWSTVKSGDLRCKSRASDNLLWFIFRNTDSIAPTSTGIKFLKRSLAFKLKVIFL